MHLLRFMENHIKHNDLIIFVNNQHDAQFFFMYVYFYSLHVPGSHVPIISRINCINETSGVCHCIDDRLVCRFGWDAVSSKRWADGALKKDRNMLPQQNKIPIILLCFWRNKLFALLWELKHNVMSSV